MSGYLQALSLYPRNKNTGKHSTGDLVGPRAGSRRYSENKNYTLPEIGPRLSSHYTDSAPAI